jgi:lantibiotic modifying enzyme
MGGTESSRSNGMSWRPILNGSPRAQALECVHAIARNVPRGECCDELSLSGGSPGVALLHAYLARTQLSEGGENAAVQCLRMAVTAAARQPTAAALFGGLSGVGWSMAHIQSLLPDLDVAADLAEIDDGILDHVRKSPWMGDYDLINGLVGIGVYALERLPHQVARACLECIVDRLAETALEEDDGLTWWTDPAWLPSPQREQFPRGYFNLGLSHGVPGVIALLARACAAGISVEMGRPLLTRAIHWLLAQQTPEGFATWVTPGEATRPARLAWCYGDLGIAVALLSAGRLMHAPEWEREALAIARRASRRSREVSGVIDAGLCHGAVGVAHLFNRLFQATGEIWLAETARYWFDEALAMRKPGRGIGGFEAWAPGDDGRMGWVADPGFLTGSAGIALALLAAATPAEPEWDRALLAAVPVSAA